MSFQVFSDSSCNLPSNMATSLNLKIFPLIFTVDDQHYQSYLEGKKVDLKQFYDMMRNGKVITTTLPNIADAEALIRSTLNSGHDVLYVGFSSALSGTFHAIEMTMESLKKEYPDRTLIAVDTLAASGGEGLLLWHLMQKVNDGLSIDNAADWIKTNRLHCAQWFTVDDLEYLFRGGRVSRISAWAGSLLNIKPVLHVDVDGRLVPVEKVRGRKKAIDAMIERMKETATSPISEQKIFITHGDCQKDVDYLVSKLQTEFGCSDIDVFLVDPVIGAHSGPGTLALFFMAEKR